MPLPAIDEVHAALEALRAVVADRQRGLVVLIRLAFLAEELASLLHDLVQVLQLVDRASGYDRVPQLEHSLLVGIV